MYCSLWFFFFIMLYICFHLLQSQNLISWKILLYMIFFFWFNISQRKFLEKKKQKIVCQLYFFFNIGKFLQLCGSLFYFISVHFCVFVQWIFNQIWYLLRIFTIIFLGLLFEKKKKFLPISKPISNIILCISYKIIHDRTYLK